MKKRVFFVFLILLILFSLTGIRLYGLTSSETQVSATASTKSVDVTTLRGTVYDCRLRPLTNSEHEIYAGAKPSEDALAALKGKVMPETFESILERMSKRNPVAVKINSEIETTENILTAKIARRYSSAFTACHIIGYLDSGNRGISGIEKAFDSVLSENNSEVRFVFSANAKGKVLLGEEIKIIGNEIPQNGVVLTIDKDIQQITEAVLDASGAECAAAVVIEIESGAIRACVSRPLFNPDSISEYLNDKKSPLINRALLPFSVGSVFKPIVAAAALESGINEDYEYNCTGSVVYNGVTFHCHKKDGHGLIDMKDAVANSCNTYFIELALKTGADNIIKTASDFGFGEKITLADGIESSNGTLPSAEEFDSKAAIANLSFGQGSLLATPLQICSAMATIARDGKYIEPYLIEGICNEDEKMTRIYNYGEKRQIISKSTAQKLKNFLREVVENGSGNRAKNDFVTVAGKTATAQTGKSKNGEEIYNAWFAGYFPADNPKYAMAILKEDGGEGAISCAPVFGTTAEKITAYVNP